MLAYIHCKNLKRMTLHFPEQEVLYRTQDVSNQIEKPENLSNEI
jgi:hypothetical protein